MALLSVVIATLDEEAFLKERLAELRRQAPEAELVVSDGGSTDGTLQEARQGADILVKCARPGRALQFDQGARAASGKVVLFLHADTRLSEGWPAALHEAFASLPPPAAAAFRLSFDDPSPVYRVLERAAGLRQRATGVPHGDQGIAVRRDAYLDCGGFPPVPLMEEYELMRRLRGHGGILSLPLPAVTSPRRYKKKGAARNAVRNNVLIALWYLGIPPTRLATWYR